MQLFKSHTYRRQPFVALRLRLLWRPRNIDQRCRWIGDFLDINFGELT